MKRPIRISITTGDVDGIGMEVVSKALSRIGPKTGVQFFLWRSPAAGRKELKRIDSEFKRATVHSWPEALAMAPSSSQTLVDIASPLSPAHWVQLSAEAATFGHLDALATAPLSKTVIQASGLKDIGHTDILKRVTKSEELFMSFIGDKFSVVLATGHKPISKVVPLFTEDRMEMAIRAADHLRRWLPPKKASKPIGVLGLNPHAGEEGLLGPEEDSILKPVMARLRTDGLALAGPLVPDAAFKPSSFDLYSVYVAAYHDQGLIPFKLVHEHRGVHITLGLPFVRTSVDHGTAKDIFGKDRADYHSMLEALKWSISLAKKDGDTKLKE